jgi:MarR family transcriptional regulator for hemolysin
MVPSALQHDFSASVGFWVGVTSHVITQALNRELADTGITYRQVQLLASLALKDEVIQTELAEDMRVESSTLVRILDRMERDGWIERHPSPTDRRVKLIRATKKVAPLWKTIVDYGQRVEARATKGLTKKQLELLRDTLAKLRHNLGETS